MTISTELRKAGPFTGNGVTTAFPFSFKVFAATDVTATRADTLGAETGLVLNIDFTVALNADQDAAPGGTVTLSAPLSTGYRLVVSSAVPNLQPTDITNNGGFYPRVIEDALDRHVAQVQQIDEKVGRALKVAITSPLGDQALPSPVAGMLIGWNESSDGLKNYAPIGGTLLGQQLAAANGSSLVGFQQAGTGAVVRTAQDKMRDSRSISDYTSLQAAAESVQTGHSIYTGGKVTLPTGAISVSAELNIPTPSIDNILGLTLNGNGKQATTLNFSSAPGGSNGVEFNHPIFFGMADVCVRQAPNNGIKVTGYNTNPALPSWNHMNLDRVRSSFNGSAGLDFDRGFMGKLNQVFATHNANAGFLFRGLHTSIHLDNCYAASNAVAGFSMTYMTYSSLTACAADTNLLGYAIANSSSTSLRNCGAESNQRSAVLATASAADGRNYPITIEGLLAFNNNTSNAGYPNAIHVLSTDSTPNYVVARACRSHDPANATVDALVSGVGAYLVDEDNAFPNGVASNNGGYIHHVNRTKYIHGLSVTTATAVCELMSHQGHQSSYGGEVVIHASNTSPNSSAAKNTATYKLLVDKGAGGDTVVEIAKAGQTTGASASFPSFTWSLVGNNLTATPVGSTGTTFYFEILCQGPIKVK